MNYDKGPELVTRSSGGRLNVAVAEDEFDRSGRPQQMMAEYGLVEAVLREAIHEYQKFAGQRGRRSTRLFREVHQWFLEDDRRWEFSFINLCQILDLEPAYIRTGLKLWTDRNVTMQQPASNTAAAKIKAKRPRCAAPAGPQPPAR